MGLTVKGVGINPTQLNNAKTLVTIGIQQAAPQLALEAIIFDAIMESSLGMNNGWDANNPTYGGILGGNKQYFGQYGAANSQAVTQEMASSWYAGTNGFHGGISIAKNFNDIAVYGAHVTAPFDQGDPPPYGQYLKQGGLSLISAVEAEARAITTSSQVTAGGVAGLGGTGTVANLASPWTTVGDPSNPDQDYWTTANQYAQQANWYFFSDGEVLYLADGYYLMAQRPAALIARTDPRCLDMQVTWDNTSFTTAITKHTLRRGIQRRATLVRTASPTEANVKWICAPDDIRAGDSVYLLGMGPGDGLWLVADCRRSYFQPFSELTLTQAMMPLSATTGYTISGQQQLTANQAAKPGSGTVLALMLAEANAIAKGNYPYVWGGDHARAGYPDRGQVGQDGNTGADVGFDCSGCVGAVLGYASAGQAWGAPVPDDAGLIQQVMTTGNLHPGQGTGRPEVTLFDCPGFHIYMRINGRYFGTWAGGSSTPGGGGWCDDGVPGGNVQGHYFKAYHFSSKYLATVVTAANNNNQASIT